MAYHLYSTTQGIIMGTKHNMQPFRLYSHFVITIMPSQTKQWSRAYAQSNINKMDSYHGARIQKQMNLTINERQEIFWIKKYEKYKRSKFVRHVARSITVTTEDSAEIFVEISANISLISREYDYSSKYRLSPLLFNSISCQLICDKKT